MILPTLPKLLPTGFLLIGAALLASCSPDRLLMSESEERDGILYRAGSEQPFSGVLITQFPDSVQIADSTSRSRRSGTAGA